jgi:hypothetical protein
MAHRRHRHRRNPHHHRLGVSYAAEATALFARFTTPPTDARKGHINTLIAALKNASVWTKLDCLWVLAAADAQAAQRNWKADAFNLTPTNAPTFAADRGYTGNASNAYLATGFNAATAGGQYAQNSGSLGVWRLTVPTTGDNRVDIGVSSSGGAFPSALIRPYGQTSGKTDVGLNDNSAAGSLDRVTGFEVVTRNDSANIILYRGSAEAATQAKTSTALNSLAMTILALNVGGTPAQFSNSELAIAFIGSGLTLADVQAMKAAFEAYLLGVGLGPFDDEGQLALLRQEYVDREVGMFIHFGLETFNNTDATDGSVPVDDFAPSAIDIDQWVTAAQALGAQYAVLTAKHHSGFCLWPSATTTYDVASTSWYAGGGFDVIDQFVTKFRAAGIEPLLYISIWDRNWEAANPGYTQAQYKAHTEAQITELLTNYGDIKGLWVDGAEWHFTGTAYPWANSAQRVAFIRSLDPECLLVNNCHTKSYIDSDIHVYEHGIDSEDLPSNNVAAAEKCISIDSPWFWKSTGYTLKTAAYLIERKTRTIARNGAFLLNMPPSDIGTIPAEYIALAAEVEAG